jgi:hypothetical protein
MVRSRTRERIYNKMTVKCDHHSSTHTRVFGHNKDTGEEKWFIICNGCGDVIHEVPVTPPKT